MPTIPQNLSLSEIQDFCRSLVQRIEKLERQNLDLKGRRVVNAGTAISPFDYTTLYDVDGKIRDVTRSFTLEMRSEVGTALARISSVIIGTAATKPAAAPSKDALFIETDTYKLYYSAGSAWNEIYAPALLKFFGATASFPALKRSSAILQARLADDSAYTDLEVLDEAYGVGWNASQEVPTKNAVYDKVEVLLGSCIQISSTADNPADATTYYYGDLFSLGNNTTDGTTQIYVPKAGTVKAAYVMFVNLGTGTTETSSIYVRKNNTSDTLISAGVNNSSATQALSNTGLSISVAAGDNLELKWVTPTWVTNPTGVIVKGLLYIE